MDHLPPPPGFGRFAIPTAGLVLLLGPAGSGKSTWAAACYLPGQILSSDSFRALVADDPTDQDASADAFRLLHAAARARLKRDLLTVVDATNLLPAARRPLLALAARYGRPVTAVVMDASLATCLARNAARADRQVPEEVVRRHHAELAAAVRALPGEGIAVLRVPQDPG